MSKFWLQQNIFDKKEQESQNKNQHRQDTMRANFQEKQTTLTFSTQIYPKINLGVRIASPDSESALPRYHVCQFSVKTDNFDFFLAQICPKGKLGFQMQGSVHFLKRGMIQN